MTRQLLHMLRGSLILLTLHVPAAQAAVAVLERMSGQPTIFEVGGASARQVSLPRTGGRYTLPIEIETGSNDSATFRLPDGEVAVAPNTIMRLAAPEPRRQGLLQRVLQKAGSALFSVDRRHAEHFQVETPYLVSVVKGTLFTVVVHEEGATVSLHEGRLQVDNRDGTQSVELMPGDIVFSDGSGDLEKLTSPMVNNDAGAPAVGDRSDAPSYDPSRGTTTPVHGGGSGTSDGGAIDEVASVAVTEPADALLGEAPGTPIVLDPSIAAGDLIGDVGETTGDLLGDVGDTAGDLIGDVGDTTGDLVGDLGDTTGDLMGDLGDSTGDLVGDVGDSAGDLVDDTADDLVGDVGDATGDMVGDVGDAAGDVGETTGDLVGDVGDTTGDLVGDTTGDLVGDVGDTTGDLVGGVGDTTGDVVEDVGGTTGDQLEETTSGLEEAVVGLLRGLDL